MRELPVSPAAVRELLRELESSGRRPHVLALGGASELAPVLRRQLLGGGGEPSALRVGEPEGADIYVHVLGVEAGPADEALLRRARRARVPTVAVAVGPLAGSAAVPYVLATDVVRVAPGEGFPLAAIARTVAARLPEDATPLAARVPLLHDAVCAQLVASFARTNALLAAAAQRRGAEPASLTLRQLRLVLRLAQAYGEQDVRGRLPELAAALGAALGLRALARKALAGSPPAPWALSGLVAYLGTVALGQAARTRFALASTPPPAAAGRAEP